MSLIAECIDDNKEDDILDLISLIPFAILSTMALPTDTNVLILLLMFFSTDEIIALEVDDNVPCLFFIPFAIESIMFEPVVDNFDDAELNELTKSSTCTEPKFFIADLNELTPLVSRPTILFIKVTSFLADEIELLIAP